MAVLLKSHLRELGSLSTNHLKNLVRYYLMLTMMEIPISTCAVAAMNFSNPTLLIATGYLLTTEGENLERP